MNNDDERDYDEERYNGQLCPECGESPCNGTHGQNAPKPTNTVIADNVLVGWHCDRVKVYLDVRLTELQGTRQTVEHATVDSATELTISGHTLRPRARNSASAGQIISDLQSLITSGVPARGFTVESLTDLLAIWQQWHLNAMRAGCAHQTMVREASPYGGERPSLTLTQPCPTSGYRYGSAWLYEPLPVDVIARLHAIFN